MKQKNMFKILFSLIILALLVSGCTGSNDADIKVETDENQAATNENTPQDSQVNDSIEGDFIEEDVEIGDLI